MTGPDERYTLVFDQTVRALSQQAASIEALRSRAGTLVAAAALTSSFLGATVLRELHLPRPAIAATVLALGGLVTSVAAALLILLPYEWRSGFAADKALTSYIEHQDPFTIDTMRRDIALHMQADIKINADKLNKLYLIFQVAVGAVGLQVGSWLIALLLS